MPYYPNQPCPVCGQPIHPRDPVTSSFRGDPAEPDTHLLIVHRRCEFAVTTCHACRKPFDEDEQRLCQGAQCYHWGCAVQREAA